MTEKTLGYVELEWECPSCKTRNPGTERKCKQCGTAHTQDVAFQQAADEKLITDEKAASAAAQAGADIQCAYCGTRNPSTAKVCKQCSAPLAEGTARASGTVLGGLRSGPAPDVICRSCGTANPARAVKCSKCGDTLAKPKPEAAKPSGSGCSTRLIVGILLGVAAIVILWLVLSSRTTDAIGQVSSVYWKRTITVEALGPVTRSDWRESIPADTQVGQCTQKLHHTSDKAESGAKEVCGTPYVVDKGSGYGEVKQQCRYEVYRSWCEYKTTDWVAVEPLVAEGKDLKPFWPDARNLGKNRRTGGKTEYYRVTLQANDQKYEYDPDDEKSFVQFTPSSRWKLKINTFGDVNSVESVR